MLSRKREDVQKRHELIQRLRRQPRFTLGQIALAVGLADHSSVLHHLNGSCACRLVRTFPLFVKQVGCEHDWRCRRCGARG